MGRKWRLTMRLMIATPLALLMVSVLAYFLVPRFVVLPLLGSKLGLDVDARRVVLLDRSSRVILEGVSVRIPGIRGAAGQVGQIQRVEGTYDWAAIFSGGMPIKKLVLVSPVVRLSQDVETGELNLAQIGVNQKSQGRTPSATPGLAPNLGRLPEITIVSLAAAESGSKAADAAIEIGEHQDGLFRRLWRIGIDGTLRPGPVAGTYQVDLEGVTDVASDSIVQIAGEIDGLGARVTISDVDLSIDPTKVPTQIRSAFARFDLVGRIPKLTVERAWGAEPLVRLQLEDVAMTLPFDARQNAGIRLLSTTGELSSVGGRISGRVRGIAEDVPYAIEFETGDVNRGELREVPFELTAVVENYLLPPDPPVVPFLPRTVQVRLDQFSNPTGIVDAQISLNRAEPGGKVSFAGQLDLREARAAYFRFPYVFEGVTGAVEFDDSGIRIKEITGRAASGARLSARGEISPPTSIAAVDLEILVNDIPIDEEFYEALGERRRPILEQILSPEGYEELLSRSMLRRPGIEGPGIEFEPGGEVSLAIKLERQLGKVSIWDRRFGISVEELRLLPDYFRVPVVAHNVLIQMTEQEVDIVRASFDSPLGLHGEVEGSIVIETPDDRSVFRPDLRIDVQDVPAGEWMRAALERVGEGTTSELLGKLGLQGRTAGRVDLVTRDDGKFGLEIEAMLDDVISLTDDLAEVAPLSVEPDRGSVKIDEEGLEFAFEGHASSPGTDSSVIQSRGTVDWSKAKDDGPLGFEISAASDAVDAWIPFEQMVAVFSPDAARVIDDLRDRYQPSGTAEVEFEIDQDRTETRLDPSSRLSFSLAGGRVAVSPTSGTAVIASEGSGSGFTAGFVDFAADVSFEDDPAGMVELAGAIPLGVPGENELDVRWANGRWESLLVRALVDAELPEQLGLWADEFDPRGVFDLHAKVTRPGEEYEPRGEVEFETLSIVRSDEQTDIGRIALGTVDGLARFSPGSIVLDGISVSSERLQAQADGVVNYEDPEHPTFEAVLRVVAPELHPSVVALMPLATRELVESLQLGVTGRVDVPGLRLKVIGDERGPGITLEGDALFSGASLTSGLKISEGDGNASLSFHAEPGEAPDFTAIVDVHRGKASGVRFTGGTTTITGSSDEPGVVQVEDASASVHGGRVSVRSVLYASEPEGKIDSYSANARLGDLSVVGVLNDLAREKDPDSELRTETGARVSGRVSLGGLSGNEQSAIGRGELSMFGGTIIELPFTLGLLEAGHFRVPTGSTIDSAHTDFYLERGVVTFESLSLLSGAVDLYGYGTMTWPGQELDLRFISRSSSRIPLLSSLAEGVRDELVTTTVRGKIGEHVVGTEPFKVARRLLREILGNEPTVQQAKIEDVAEQLNNRTRRRRVTAENEPLWPKPISASDASVLPSNDDQER